MSRRVGIVLMIVTMVVLVGTLGACRFLGFINPAWALEGSWEITSVPQAWTDSLGDIYYYFEFTPDADGYRIRDAERTVFESGIITELTDSNFDYEIVEYTPDPGFVTGNKNYAEYTRDRDDLSITFYADRDKSANFGTIIAVRE